MTNQELINKLEIPAGTEYPAVNFRVDGNIFAVISAVSRAWRPVNKEVSNRIFSIVNDCESYEEALGFLMSISKVEYHKTDEDKEECEDDSDEDFDEE